MVRGVVKMENVIYKLGSIDVLWVLCDRVPGVSYGFV